MTADPYQANDDGSDNPGEPQSWNRYAYVLSDPVTFYDPDGLMAQCPAGTHVSADGHGCTSILQPRGGGVQGVFKKTPVHQMPGEGGGGGGGGGGSAPQVPCTNAYSSAQLNFVKSNYGSAVSLSVLSRQNVSIILGWGALETGFGTNTAANVNRNFFSWGGQGNTTCPNGADQRWGCYTNPGFFNSGSDALFSTQNYFQWNGQKGVSANTILTDSFNSGDTISQAFDALAQAGYTPDPGYGAGVAADTGVSASIINCLQSLGQLGFPRYAQ